MPLAGRRAGSDESLPARRDLGITIARRDRPAAVVAPSLQRSAQLHQQFGVAGPESQDLELSADATPARSGR